MGQQQLLLLVLGIVVVGLAVVVGIQAFDENQHKSTVDRHTNAGIAISADLVAHYQKPASMGGLEQDGSTMGSVTISDLGYTQDVADTYGGLNRTGTLDGGVVRHLVQNGQVPFMHIHEEPLEAGDARVEVFMYGPGEACLVSRSSRWPVVVWSDGGSDGTAPENPDPAACSW